MIPDPLLYVLRIFFFAKGLLVEVVYDKVYYPGLMIAVEVNSGDDGAELH